MNAAKNYLYKFEEIAARPALVRHLGLTYSPGRPTERTVDSRFSAIVDGANGAELAAVSARYTLVQNRDIVTAVERAGDTLGVKLEQKGGMYRNGVSKLRWHLPDVQIHPEGTGTPMTGTFEAGNDYGAGGSITGEGGWWVEICSNGMRRLMWAVSHKLRHVGEISVDTLVPIYCQLLQDVVEKADDNAQVVSLLANTDMNDAWVDRVIKSLRDNRQPIMVAAIKTNVADHGETAWALAQAVTEAATHSFPDTWANQQWAAKQVESLIKDVQRVGVA